MATTRFADCHRLAIQRKYTPSANGLSVKRFSMKKCTFRFAESRFTESTLVVVNLLATSRKVNPNPNYTLCDVLQSRYV